jgi:drug/metabolite transporter (DMT)-like permease
MMRPLFGRYSAMRLSTLMIIVGAVLMAPISIHQLSQQNFAALGALRWGSLAYSTIFPLIVTNVLYFTALPRVGAARATLFMYLQPFLGALFAALLLGEQIGAVQIAGGAVIVGGVALGRTARAHRRRRPGLELDLEPPGEPS